MLNQIAMGISIGVACSFGILFISLLTAIINYGQLFIDMIISIYPGYTITPLGILIGIILAFADGFIGSYCITLMYNWFENKI